MGRFHQAAAEGGEQAIDIAPVNMIDLMLILLIFFIVSTTFVQQTGVEVDKPAPAVTARELSKTSILIALTAKGEVYYGGKEIGISGVGQQVKLLLQRDSKIPVVIQADTTAPSGILMRIVDEAKRAGATEVNVATKLQTKK